MRFSSPLVGAASIALIIASAQAQEIAPPKDSDILNITYANDGNGVIAVEEVPFATCVASENAFTDYSYLNFAPSNATINFYLDSNCQVFAFGLNGSYGGHPGKARSYRWVGWSMDNLGEIFKKIPIQGPGAATGGDTQTNPGGKNPGETTPVPPPVDNNNNNHGQDGSKTADGSTSDTTKTSTSSTFFGGVVGSLVVLAVGGVIFWKTAGKKLVEDKGKGVLPYNRVGRDGDILLTNSRSHNSFEIGDEDDEDDEVDTRRQQHSGRQERYRDDDQA
ncbi:hypothetical protein KVV02_001016 [Mortierella alpina]|uniref:Mid2 domain-containing protein n=1 Tax=Mortierella alpina TaxID=64518 RepID=A0A9P8A9Z6_MORAP|nr:hypothetical protein KVV02_001016 [Mortierella alpina]